MKSAAHKMTKAEAVEAMAAILGQLGSQVDLHDVAAEAAAIAEDRREYRRKLKEEALNWPLFNEEDGAARTWAEHIAYCIEVGEWHSRWGTPPEPK